MNDGLFDVFLGPMDYAYLQTCDDRASVMLRLRNEGVAVKQIARQFDVSYQRVIQITNQRYSALLVRRDACRAIASGGVGQIPIKGAGLSKRATRALLNDNIVTVGEAAASWDQLRGFLATAPNVGRKTIAEIESRLLELGFDLAGAVQPEGKN